MTYRFMKFIVLIAIIFRIHVNTTYFSNKIQMCVRSIFYYIDSANKGLVQEILMLVFFGVYIINRKIHGRLEIRHLSSRVEKYFSRSQRLLVKINVVSQRDHVTSSISSRPFVTIKMSRSPRANQTYRSLT